MSRKSLMAGAVMALLATCGFTPVQAEVVIPSEWVGIWESETEAYDCDSNVFLFNLAGADTLCPGAVFEDPGSGGEPLDCTSSADGETYTSHCEGTSEVEPGCLATFTFDITGTRTGDTMTSITTLRTTVSGTCVEFAASCIRFEETATRIAEPPASCEGTPNEKLAWGALKSSYR